MISGFMEIGEQEIPASEEIVRKQNMETKYGNKSNTGTAGRISED